MTMTSVNLSSVNDTHKVEVLKQPTIFKKYKFKTNKNKQTKKYRKYYLEEYKPNEQQNDNLFLIS